MIATYRLSQRLACFDYYYWQVQAHAEGATEIVLDITNPKTRKFPLNDIPERVRSIIEPGAAFSGLKSRIGTNRGTVEVEGVHDIHAWYRSGKRFPRLKTVKPAVQCEYTVTIRENLSGIPERDSNKDASRRFAEEIGAVLIEDYYRKPIHIHDRMALYAGAKMNFGVCNGPMALLSLTEYPVTIFVNSEAARNSQIRANVLENQKLPWMLDNQHMIWQEDTFDNLRRWFDQWKP